MEEKDGLDFLRKLEKSQTLLNVLVSVEDFFDGIDLYGFANWVKGEIVEGPLIDRYWVTIVLKYHYRDMPDPLGASRLIARGLSVEYVKASQEFQSYSEKDELMISIGQKSADGTTLIKKKKIKIWLVVVKIPRRFVEDQIEEDLEEFEEEVDTEDVSDALDDGLEQEDSITGSDEVDPADAEEDTNADN